MQDNRSGGHVDTANPYYRQVRLLPRVLPLIAQEPWFALKGGTAINLFVRDLPRLSVDIDLVYLPMDDRETALKNITIALGRIADSIQKAMPAPRSSGHSRIAPTRSDSSSHRVAIASRSSCRRPSRIGISRRATGVFAPRRGEVRLRGNAVALASGLLRWQDLRRPRPPAPTRSFRRETPPRKRRTDLRSRQDVRCLPDQSQSHDGRAIAPGAERHRRSL